MSLLSWLFQGPGFRRFEDCYARTRELMLDGLTKAIVEPTFHRDLLLVTTHFTSTFVEVQTALDKVGIEYEIAPSHVTDETVRVWLRDRSKNTVLCLAGSFEPMELAESPDGKQHVAFVVTERHPWVPCDEAIERFARGLDHKTHLGYYMSMDDAIVRRSINSLVSQLLKNVGMEDQMISSNLVSARISAKLKRMNRSIENPRQANSPQEWLELNAPDFVSE